MLVQNPSRIFKADLSVWKKENSCILNEIVIEEDCRLRKTIEVVFDRSGSFELKYQSNSSILIIVLYGEILINDFEKPISAEQIFTLKSSDNNVLAIKNNLPNEKADILIFELKSKIEGDFFTVEDLNLDQKNTLIQISENLELPNFIGLYDGRREEEYSLYKKGKSIFGMVINGAFEFQNRLMEVRDAIIISKLETLEFEALSENALIIFFEI